IERPLSSLCFFREWMRLSASCKLDGKMTAVEPSAATARRLTGLAGDMTTDAQRRARCPDSARQRRRSLEAGRYLRSIHYSRIESGVADGCPIRLCRCRRLQHDSSSGWTHGPLDRLDSGPRRGKYSYD